MRIVGVCRTRISGLVLTTLLSVCLLFVINESADAFVGGGSWGSGGSGGSGGSWGSRGGSFGSRGGYRTPVRNLLGRMHTRHQGSRGGGSSGGSSGGSTGYGSSGGSLGGSYVSYGSSGGSGGSAGSVGSSYAYSSSAAGYGSWGSSYLSTLGSSSDVVYAPGYIDGSAPIDSYVAPGYSLDSVPMQGGVVEPAVPESFYDRGAQPSGDSILNGGGDSQTPVPPPGPVEGDDSTRVVDPMRDAIVLNVVVPIDAKVYINDNLTQAKGEERGYVSRDLKPDRDYHYEVKAVVVRDDKEIVRTELVSARTGSVRMVAMDFDAKPTTSLALEVPADAEVKLCGKETSATGRVRHFATSVLAEGMTWKDYTIQVSVQRDGKTVTREQTLDLLAGDTHSFKFDFDDATTELVVSK
jgi:uncharacterized protein (TIGR03000 family)